MNRTTRLKKPQIPELDTLYQFDDLGGRPKYGGVEMTSATDIPSFQEIMDETHSAVVAEATARDDADDALQAQIDSLDSDLTAETTAREAADQAEATARAAADQAETTARTSADNNLQTQIDAIVASSDVKDIVGTYAELQAYDTSTLGDRDIIKVLQDETHQDETTYYRWGATAQTFTLIGEEGPYYTKAATDTLLDAKADKTTTYTKTETDTLLGAKQDTLTAGDAIDITNNVIKATNTGKARVLTADDYNYPANNPDRIALWLLPPGVYTLGSGINNTKIATTASSTLESNYDTFILGGVRSDNFLLVVAFRYDSNYEPDYPVWIARIRNDGGSLFPARTVFDSRAIVNNLTSPWPRYVLSANQGYVLNNKIGDLSTLTTTDKTSAVAAINELVSGGSVSYYSNSELESLWEGGA